MTDTDDTTPTEQPDDLEDRVEAIRADDSRYRVVFEATPADFVRLLYGQQLAASRFRDHSMDEAKAHLALADEVLDAMPDGVRENLGIIGESAQESLNRDLANDDLLGDAPDDFDPDDSPLADGGRRRRATYRDGRIYYEGQGSLDTNGVFTGNRIGVSLEVARQLRDDLDAALDEAESHREADSEMVTDGGQDLHEAPDDWTPGTLVVDRNLDDDEDAEADSERAAVVIRQTGHRAADYTVGSDDTPLPDFESNADDCGDDQVVMVAFASHLDGRVPDWEDWVADPDTDFTEKLTEYSGQYRVHVQTYGYPWTRLRRLDGQIGDAQSAQDGQGSAAVKDAAVPSGGDE